jgi:hypothetical protein
MKIDEKKGSRSKAITVIDGLIPHDEQQSPLYLSQKELFSHLCSLVVIAFSS